MGGVGRAESLGAVTVGGAGTVAPPRCDHCHSSPPPAAAITTPASTPFVTDDRRGAGVAASDPPPTARVTSAPRVTGATESGGAAETGAGASPITPMMLDGVVRPKARASERANSFADGVRSSALVASTRSNAACAAEGQGTSGATSRSVSGLSVRRCSAHAMVNSSSRDALANGMRPVIIWNAIIPSA